MLKKIMQKVICVVQVIIITICLFIVYFVGFGITLIIVMLFNRKIIFIDGGIKDTYWTETGSCCVDTDDGLRQS